MSLPTPNPSNTRSESVHWLDRPRNVAWLWRGFLIVLGFTVLAGLWVPMHAHFAIESVFGFFAWFGFLACAAMIVVAKALALLLKRPDTYYGQGARDD